MEGKLFNIQRFSVHDGPGIRTTVFFKGCNLKCKWCHNPESISSSNQIEFYREKCIECGACQTVCSTGAHFIAQNHKHTFNRAKCTGCFACTDNCFSNALTAVGMNVSAEYVFKSVCADKLYYKNSSGGVTFSGGEAMLQIDFLEELLQMCKREGIHTAIDTAGCVPWSYFQRILETADLFLYDVKAVDPLKHKQLTGMDNHLILENLKKLLQAGKHIHVRIPFIPGLNDDQTEDMAKMLKTLNMFKVEIMPYHKLGNSKYAALDLENELLGLDTPSEQTVEKAMSILRDHGLKVFKS